MRKVAYLTLRRSALKNLKQQHSAFDSKAFKTLSDAEYKRISSLVPDIGKSVFAFNYESAPATFALYSASLRFGFTNEEAVKVIWDANERLFASLPFFVRRLWGKSYLRNFEKHAEEHEIRGKRGLLHPLDWRIEYLGAKDGSLGINVMECAYVKLAKELGLEGVLPGICRMDYLLASMTGTGFERTMTLGDRDILCNCRYSYSGSVSWPVKGLK